jgi:hypothetical protein
MAMTKRERDELGKILKGRARVAQRVVDQRAAELLADVEQQLATKYKIDDGAWRDLTATADQVVSKRPTPNSPAGVAISGSPKRSAPS